MPRTCTVCSHDERRRIDQQIVSGKTNRFIANQFRLTAASVQRHKKHVAAELERAAEKREISIGESVLDRLESLYQRGLTLLAKAERAKAHSACASYLRELRGLLAGLYEVAREVAPPSAESKMLPEHAVRAISRALGVDGPLVPIGKLPLLPGASGQVDDGEILDVLPE